MFVLGVPYLRSPTLLQAPPTSCPHTPIIFQNTPGPPHLVHHLKLPALLLSVNATQLIYPPPPPPPPPRVPPPPPPLFLTTAVIGSCGVTAE